MVVRGLENAVSIKPPPTTGLVSILPKSRCLARGNPLGERIRPLRQTFRTKIWIRRIRDEPPHRTDWCLPDWDCGVVPATHNGYWEIGTDGQSWCVPKTCRIYTVAQKDWEQQISIAGQRIFEKFLLDWGVERSTNTDYIKITIDGRSNVYDRSRMQVNIFKIFTGSWISLSRWLIVWIILAVR